MWLVTSVCLYIYMSLMYERVLEKCFWGTGKVLEIFLNKRVGTLMKLHLGVRAENRSRIWIQEILLAVSTQFYAFCFGLVSVL